VQLIANMPASEQTTALDRVKCVKSLSFACSTATSNSLSGLKTKLAEFDSTHVVKSTCKKCPYSYVTNIIPKYSFVFLHFVPFSLCPISLPQFYHCHPNNFINHITADYITLHCINWSDNVMSKILHIWLGFQNVLMLNFGMEQKVVGEGEKIKNIRELS